jgi:hypothetical protein
MKTSDANKFRIQENLHILFWLIKDMCWVMLFKPLGIAMIAPTLIISIYLTIKNRKDITELTHNIAVCCWISANSIWMIGEFYFEDGLRNYAVVFFTIGLISVCSYYLGILPYQKWIRDNNKLSD